MKATILTETGWGKSKKELKEKYKNQNTNQQLWGTQGGIRKT